MNDNFDINVAKRKPNVSGKKRPSHPWDVQNQIHESDTDSNVHPHDANIDKTTDTVTKPAIKKTLLKKTKHIVTHEPASHKSSNLSNTIDIHSNYCKLDNDISDKLFCILSPSAQSVYLRLYRQSFGWNRNWAAESLPKLTKSCNLSLQTIRKAIKELERTGCIRKDMTDYHKATVYRVYLPSEIGTMNYTGGNTTVVNNTPLLSNSLNTNSSKSHVGLSTPQNTSPEKPDSSNSHSMELQLLEDYDIKFRGSNSTIQSVYFSGTSIYNLLESGGALPKNISKYITDKHLIDSVEIIDNFYDSIGFSIVSRALYRKSLIDYFDLIKSGFSTDDIKYAVRWTFKNSRSRPESFSLIKHTIHLAMDDLISDLKNISGEKELAQEKKEAIKKNIDRENEKHIRKVSDEDVQIWLEIVEELKGSLNENSFMAFINPLQLVDVEDNKVLICASPDSVSWVVDHYQEIIEEFYRKKTGKDIIVEIE